ncbi:type 2 periplasmic-binding domain-containing protein [Pseudochryseolinea flava]|uniref:Phosphate ABC transporter substrate-binding protein n=1 Tax=Pseudochryseolinea flava TaxID=2059302 RepID=A0A364XYY0_9BACT|nr:hypothetical protein [Pseudochryseolinea flava]RAV99019.1 hypothetical protein DQQ10_20710 [Pseudochryseolinea flava]
MKRYLFTSILIISIATSLFGQKQHEGLVKVKGTRLTYPLVRKWIAEFNKDYPSIKVTIAQQSPADSIDLNLAAYSIVDGDLAEPKEFVSITRYVQLPVANNKREGLAALQAKGFTASDLNALYFSSDKPNFLTASQSPITLYTRERPACAAITFAKHYGNDPKSIQGVGVKGDDQDLAKAVKEDVNGISFNNLGFTYDVNTRKVTEGLAVIPLDLNENGHVDKDEQVYESLDELITFIEKTNHPKFVTENVNAVFDKSKQNDAAGIFLLWVLTKGQQYNHALGFLGVEQNILNTQRKKVSANFKTSSASCTLTPTTATKRTKKSN